MNAVVSWPVRPSASRRLICCGYSGGGTVPFRQWADAVAPDVELVMLCYPGREGRFTDPLAERWDELLDDALDAVGSVADKPYHLFGHSLGALVAFELAARLPRPPDALIVSSSEAPTNWVEHLQVPPTAHDTDAELIGWLTEAGRLAEEVREDPDLLEMALEMMRADLTAADTYAYSGTVLTIPIDVVYGADDADITPAVIDRWRDLTTGSFSTTELPGGHFYTDTAWAELPRLVPRLAAASGSTDPRHARQTRNETGTCQA